VVTDPHSASASPNAESVIENEIPTYRAISSWAVASIVLGVISGVAFANLYFLVAAIGAVVSGAIAQRMIRAYPDLLTGRGLANLGIALGLICGLGATTYKAVQWTLIGKEATAFAEVYGQVLREGSFADAFWYQQPPPVRRDRDPQEMYNQFREETADQDMAMVQPELITFQQLQERVQASDETHVHVDAIERRGFDGTIPFAEVRLHIEGPGSEQFPAEQSALLRLRGITGEHGREWYVERVTYPYESGAQARVIEPAHTHDH